MTEKKNAGPGEPAGRIVETEDPNPFKKPGDEEKRVDPMEDHGGGSDVDGSDVSGTGASGGGENPVPEH